MVKTAVINLSAKIKKAIHSGKYRISKHAIARQFEREVTLQDILFVLSNGYHEEKMSIFDNTHQAWKYAIRGNTVDNTDLRVIIAFTEEMIIITVIKIKGGKK